MRARIHQSLGFVWTTAMGGVFFLLPLLVIGTFLGRVYSIVEATAKPLHDWIPVNTPVGIAFLFSLAVAILIGLCFLCGVLASQAIGKKFSDSVEKQLMMVFPKYAIYKDLLAGNLRNTPEGPSLKPVLVQVAEGERLAFEADRTEQGRVVIYLPGAPDTWNGSVIFIEASRVHDCSLSFAEAVSLLERLGRQSRSDLAQIPAP
ncbi:MAG: hypothetical protein U0905_15590 [Pirellulales bacterium]